VRNNSKARNSESVVIDGIPIPRCQCGSPRVFEAQILPSLLHVLDVDRHSVSAKGDSVGGKCPSSSLEKIYSEGGMNWGNIAVYTCSKGCSNGESGAPLKEYVVVQRSVDGQLSSPPRPMHSYDPIVIEEGTDFGREDVIQEDGGGEDSGGEDEINNY